jgi:hypothetical protein
MEINKEKYLRVIAKKLMKGIEKNAKTNTEKGFDFKDSGKNGGRTERWNIGITEEDLFERLKETNGICERTGIPFPLVSKEKYYSKEYARKLGFNPMIAPSADRVDPKIGYDNMDNLQLVVQGYNLAKNNKSQDEMNEFIKMMQNPPTEHTIYDTINETKETKTNNTNKKQSNMNKEFLNYLMNENDFENAEKYFDYRNTQNKGKKTQTTNSRKRTMSHSERKNWFAENSTFINQCDDNMISITAMCLNSSGYMDNTRLMQSKWSQIVIDKKLKTYALPKGRGVEYFINREDRKIIGK